VSNAEIDNFIQRWQDSGAAERSNSQTFLNELCDLLEVPRPDPAQAEVEADAYVFERPVTFHHGDGTTSTGFIDLYKRGCFVLESKQGVLAKEPEGPLAKLARKGAKRRKGVAARQTPAWDEAMIRAKAQAENYIRHLPASEGRPPLVMVADVGHSIELYAEFSMTGGAYLHFPDPQSHRILLEDLRRPEIRERLRLAWTNPLALDPSRRAAKVTQEIAGNLAELAKSLEQSGHSPEQVAEFLSRCLFTMFAEDVDLLPKGGFSKLLGQVADSPGKFKAAAEDLWRAMKTGDFSSFLMERVLHFNGYLFAEAWALELDQDQVRLLMQAAKADWRDVEPAIFGTLLERALDPVERHKLGAHYTPRAYVERLVMPTIMEPLRAEWEAVKAAAFTLSRQAEELELQADELSDKDQAQVSRQDLSQVRAMRKEAGQKAKESLQQVLDFHKKLCDTKVLDPACGSGNFLYVSMEHMKRLEGEVLEALEQFGYRQKGFELASGRTVDPHQFLGIEINPRAAAIAQLVLWIGYLQWHFRTHGNTNPPEPIIRDFKNIEHRDSVLAYDGTRPAIDKDTLQPVTRWDGRTYKESPVTGEMVPDESARVLVEEYLKPRKAQWPKADYVVGNPPFMGIGHLRQAMGDGYAETIRKVYKDIPGSCDYVLYWWSQAAHLARRGKIKRFGFITTNSMSQTLNRRVAETHLNAKPPLSIIFAIPDHPWVDAAEGAAVRIAMTVGEGGEHEGSLLKVVKEERIDGEERRVELAGTRGLIQANLTIGVNTQNAFSLKGNKDLSQTGVKLHGAGFIVTKEEASELGLGQVPGLEKYILEYRHGKDIAQTPRDVMVIDLEGLSEKEVTERFPAVYQRVYTLVKPERDQNRDKSRRKLWWLFGRRHTKLRNSLRGLPRFISTPETAKHRFFVFMDQSIRPDNMLINIALDDAYCLGVLSSRLHVVWALAAGGRLGVGNDPRYNKTRCFETFPFPDPSESLKARIRDLGERLDALRKRQQEQHPGLTMTGMYNVLEKLRSGEPLSAKEREINDQGLVSLLKQIHGELDAAVFEAYGWPPDLSDEQILERLVALNQERAAEEAEGLVRWLRPEYQNPAGSAPTQRGFAGMEAKAPAKAQPAKQPWPKTMAEQAQAVRQALASLDAPASVETVAKCFLRAKRDRVAELLETLVGLGQARVTRGGEYVGG